LFSGLLTKSLTLFLAASQPVPPPSAENMLSTAAAKVYYASSKHFIAFPDSVLNVSNYALFNLIF